MRVSITPSVCSSHKCYEQSNEITCNVYKWLQSDSSCLYFLFMPFFIVRVSDLVLLPNPHRGLTKGQFAVQGALVTHMSTRQAQTSNLGSTLDRGTFWRLDYTAVLLCSLSGQNSRHSSLTACSVLAPKHIPLPSGGPTDKQQQASPAINLFYL